MILLLIVRNINIWSCEGFSQAAARFVCSCLSNFPVKIILVIFVMMKSSSYRNICMDIFHHVYSACADGIIDILPAFYLDLDRFCRFTSCRPAQLLQQWRPHFKGTRFISKCCGCVMAVELQQKKKTIHSSRLKLTKKINNNNWDHSVTQGSSVYNGFHNKMQQQECTCFCRKRNILNWTYCIWK